MGRSITSASILPNTGVRVTHWERALSSHPEPSIRHTLSSFFEPSPPTLPPGLCGFSVIIGPDGVGNALGGSQSRNPMMIGMGAGGIGNTLVVEDAGTCYGYPIPPSNRQGGTKPHPWPRFDGCRRHRRITVAGRVSTLAIKGRRGERQRQGAKSRDVNYSRRMPISPAEAGFYWGIA